MLYEVVMRQLLFGQQVINRMHYNGSGTPAAVSRSFALISALGFIPDGVTGVYPVNRFFTKLIALQSPGLTHVEVECRALYDPVDFYVRPFTTPVAGIFGSETVSPLVAYGFTSTRVRTDIRRGQKRFGGVAEEAVANGGVLSATVQVQGLAVANALGEVLTYDDEGNTLTFAPVVLSFREDVSPSGRPVYVKYDTLAEQEQHMAQGITYTLKQTVRSQNSRQYGRGA